MPTYAYKCTNCEHRFDARQRFSDDPLTECPQCQGTLRRVINSVGIVFKGSGFYVTDNKNGKVNSALTGNGRSEKPDEKEKGGEKKENVTPPDKKSDSVGAGNAT